MSSRPATRAYAERRNRSLSSTAGKPRQPEQRLGHQVPGMRGLYAHASQRMRDELTAALQVRWEESVRERTALACVHADA